MLRRDLLGFCGAEGMADSDDPICFTLGMLRFLGDDVASTLSEHGWAVADRGLGIRF